MTKDLSNSLEGYAACLPELDEHLRTWHPYDTAAWADGSQPQNYKGN